MLVNSKDIAALVAPVRLTMLLSAKRQSSFWPERLEQYEECSNQTKRSTISSSCFSAYSLDLIAKRKATLFSDGAIYTCDIPF